MPRHEVTDNAQTLPEIWIGDLLRLWGQFGLSSADERAAVAGLLGFECSRPAAITPPLPDEAPSADWRRDRGAEFLSTGPLPVGAKDSPADPRALPDDVSVWPARVVEEQGPDRHREPEWMRQATPLEGESGRHAVFQPPYESLFERRWTRAILGAVGSTVGSDGPIDLRELIDKLATGRPVGALPRQPVATLRKGVHLALDYSESMTPFFRDMEELTRRVISIVGRDRTMVLRFSGDIEQGTELEPGSNWLVEPSLPPSGTPVLILSDLGLSRGALLRDVTRPFTWIETARRLGRAECPMTAIVPLPLERIPRSLTRAMRIVPWDRRTTVLKARHIAAGNPA